MHLLIVNDQTLAVTLRYGFVGTTRKDPAKKVVAWSQAGTLHPQAEKAQAWLYADICGVNKGDEILFYLERPGNDTKREGGHFFGIFRCVSDAPFFEPDGAYLQDELGIPVYYRALVEPVTVYAKGLTEWYMMDEMGEFRSVQEIPWTLIYRKMAGGRGCTPLLPHEAKMIRRLLDLKNAGQQLPPTGIGYSSRTLSLCVSGESSPYAGDTARIPDITKRTAELIDHPTRSAEMQVEAYLMQELRRNDELTRALFPGHSVQWVGNEIFCGAGLQRIDMLVYASNDMNQFIHLLELKGWDADSDAAPQLNRYIKWLKAHIPGITPQQIIPTIVCPGSTSGFHEQLRIYLQGHGIESYREIRFSSGPKFELLTHDL